MFKYNCVIRVAAMCDEAVLKNVINQKIDRVDIDFNYCASNNDLPENCDVVFIGTKDNPFELRRKYGNKTRIILCASEEFAQNLSDEALSEIDRIWETPLNPTLTPYRFKHLVGNIITEMDHRMNLNCLDTAINTLPDMLWFKSVDGIHVKVNEAFCNIVNKTSEDVTGQTHCYIWDVDEDEAFACQESDEQVMREKKVCSSIETVKSHNELRQFKTYKSPIFSEDGQILGTVGIGHDITDLQNLGAEMEIVLNSMPYSVVICDNNNVIIEVNRRFEEYFKVNSKEIIGKSYTDWHNGAFNKQTKHINNQGHIEIETRYTDKVLVIYEENIIDVFGNIVGKISVYRDITNTKLMEEKIIHSYNTDFLTGLNNRRSFYNHINENRSDNPISIISLDLDNFKQLNDMFGHKTGDDALVSVSNLFRRYFSDDFIARFGGDEFVIAVLSTCTTEEIKEKIESMQKAMFDEFENIEGFKLLTLSVGIAQSDNPQVDIDELILQSDKALYEAKANGKNRCCVYETQM